MALYIIVSLVFICHTEILLSLIHLLIDYVLIIENIQFGRFIIFSIEFRTVRIRLP